MNRSRVADELLYQLAFETNTDIVLISEQYRNRDQPTWFSDPLSTSAIWISSSRNIRVEGHGSEEGFVWVRCKEMTFFSCYLTPNEYSTLLHKGDRVGYAAPGLPRKGYSRNGLIVLNEREVITFRRPGYSETIPNVSFASEALAPRIVDWKISENCTGSDHQAITFTVYGRPEARCWFSPISGGWNFGKLDAERLCRALPPVCRLIAGSEVDARERVERLVESTMSGIASACDASMPRKAPRHCRRAAYWWTAEIPELRRRCLRLRRIAQRAGNREEARG
ncbi:hypothetical protein Trydic_g11716 [Trypoxylus dichotomus]